MSSHAHLCLKPIVIALTLLYSGLSFSDTRNVVVNPITPGSLSALSSDNLSSNVFFPLYPRLNVTGGTGNNNYGAADVMVPLLGSSSAIIYTDVGGQTGKGKSNRLSLGVGARDAINDDVMWGGYAFIDRSKANDSDGANHWTVINPGVEFMTNHWDGRVNGYIPAGNKENMRGPFFGDQVGNPNAETFTAHDQFSRLFNKVDEIGPGIDADAGYTFTHLRRFRVHGGAYYFTLPDTGDIKGGEAGAEMPINNYAALQFDDSYDDIQKNTAVISVRFTLGGIDKFAADPTIQERILDPVYRHLGALGTNTGMPSNNGIVEISGPPVLEQSNVWYYDANSSTAFNPSAGLNNCTFQHPCKSADFNQSNINLINGISPNANFYFTPGTYTFGPISNRLSLNTGQSMYGRNSAYTLAASSDSGFPTFVGGLDPQGNNTLDSFALINNNDSETIGIHLQNANNILMNNLKIGQMNDHGSYATSIQLDSANNITLQNSTISSSEGETVNGILDNGPGVVTLNNNRFTLTTETIGDMFGVKNTSTGTVNLTNNTFILDILNPTGAGSNIGVNNTSSGTINMTGNTFTLATNTGVATLTAISNNTGIINLANNTFTLTTTGVGSTTGIINNSTGIVDADNNIFTISGTIGTLNGINNASTGIVNSTSDRFTLTNGAGTVNVILNSSSGTVNASSDIFNVTAGSGLGITGVNNTSTGTVNLDNNTFTLINTGAGPTTGITNPSGTVHGSNNTFSFTGTGTKTCGTFTSGSGNTFNNCT